MGLLRRAFSKKDGGTVTHNKNISKNKNEEDDLWLNIRREDDPSVIWKEIGELGDGAFGKVYKVQQKVTGILAAAKVIQTRSEEELAENRGEIDILFRTVHANIIRLLDAIYSKDMKLWVMLEWCEGGALDAGMLEIESALSEQQIRVVGRHTAEALTFLHSRLVIHRDVKAGNLLLTNEGVIKLADFGVSVQNESRDEKRTTFIGTPYWMAPEVVMCETFKDVPYDSKCDVWSFGITLIELAQMEPPHHDMNPVRVLLKIPKADPPTLEKPEQWSRDFHTIIKLCMKKNPEARSTAGELCQHAFFKNVESNESLRELYYKIKELAAKHEKADQERRQLMLEQQQQMEEEGFDGEMGFKTDGLESELDGLDERGEQGFMTTNRLKIVYLTHFFLNFLRYFYRCCKPDMNRDRDAINERKMQQRMREKMDHQQQVGRIGRDGGLGGDKIIVDGQEVDVNRMQQQYRMSKKLN